MAEFDEKLNSLLSNPDAMSQIMRLANSLSGEGVFENSSTPPPQSPPSPPQQQPAPNISGDLFSTLAGGMDPTLLMKMLPLIQELGSQQNSNARQLLYALRPYLKKDRQDKVERALQLAKLFHLGKTFLTTWEG